MASDDDAFEAEPATKPLDVSQHVLLTEPPDKIYAQYGFPISHFLTSDPISLSPHVVEFTTAFPHLVLKRLVICLYFALCL